MKSSTLDFSMVLKKDDPFISSLHKPEINMKKLHSLFGWMVDRDVQAC